MKNILGILAIIVLIFTIIHTGWFFIKYMPPIKVIEQPRRSAYPGMIVMPGETVEIPIKILEGK